MIIDDKFWIDHKGRKIEISTMSNKWLNNIRKLFREDRDRIRPIMDEIKRRKKKYKKHHENIRKGS